MEELRDFIIDNRSKNTKKKTDSAVKKFQNFLSETNEEKLIHEIDPKQLNIYLGQFFISAKRDNGEDYEPESLTGLHRSIERHLRDYSYSESILRSASFQTSRDVLKSRKEVLKSMGKGNLPNKAEAVTDREEEIMWEKGVLGSWSPMVLIHTIWYLNTKLFGLRGCTEHHSIRNGDISLKVTADGDEYLEFNERLSKTRRGKACDARPFNPKAFPAEEKERCLVHLYKEYQSRKPTEMLQPDAPFYLTINYARSWDDSVWYKKSPVGVNTLGQFMKKMAQEAGLTGKKTNHAVRSTTCTKLMHAGVPDSVACQLTGHRNTNSLKRYATASVDQQRIMSGILTNGKRPALPQPGSSATMLKTGATLPSASSSESRQPLKEITNCQQSAQPQSQLNPLLSGLFAGSTINGGKFNITINVQQNSPQKPKPMPIQKNGWNLPQDEVFEVEIDDSVFRFLEY